MAPALDRIDRAQRSFTPIGLPLAVIYKFFDDQGNYLAATITYYAFVAIFPLLLLGTSALALRAPGQPRPGAAGARLGARPVPDHRVGAGGARWAERVDHGDRPRFPGRAVRRARARPGDPERHEHRLVGPAEQPAEPGPAAHQEPAPADDRRARRCSRSPCSRSWPATPRRSARASRRTSGRSLLGTVLVNTLVFTFFFRFAAARRHGLRTRRPGRLHRRGAVAGTPVPRDGVRPTGPGQHQPDEPDLRPGARPGRHHLHRRGDGCPGHGGERRASSGGCGRVPC